MSLRFPPLQSDQDHSVDSELDDGIKRGLRDHSDRVKYRDRNGAPAGPFSVLAYTPECFQPYVTLASSIINQANFSPIERELAVLAVTAVHDLPYVLYSHTSIALAVGLSEDQVESASRGIEPKGLSEKERTVYMTALELAAAKTSLDENTWQVAESILGKERCARLAQVVGLYLYTGTLLKMGAVPVPNESQP